MLNFHCLSSVPITSFLILMNAFLIAIPFIHLSHFYCLCSTLYFPVSILPWDPSDLIFISEIDLAFSSSFLLEYWQLTFPYLLPSCHPSQNSCFCFVAFLHRNDCFIEVFKFIVKSLTAIFTCSLRTFSWECSLFGGGGSLIFVATVDIFHYNIFASILPKLSISLFLLCKVGFLGPVFCCCGIGGRLRAGFHH